MKLLGLDRCLRKRSFQWKHGEESQIEGSNGTGDTALGATSTATAQKPAPSTAPPSDPQRFELQVPGKNT